MAIIKGLSKPEVEVIGYTREKDHSQFDVMILQTEHRLKSNPRKGLEEKWTPIHLTSVFQTKFSEESIINNNNPTTSTHSPTQVHSLYNLPSCKLGSFYIPSIDRETDQ